MPVAAVNNGGSPSVSSGSQIALFGIKYGLINASFEPLVRLSKAPRPTSLPVPAVVGTAITGATCAVILLTPPRIAAYCSSGPA